MVKTLRISEKTHKRMLKIQGLIQQDSGKYTSMDVVMDEVADCFNKVWRKKI